MISHKEYKDRAQFDSALHAALQEAQIDIVCLAGFMRILTGKVCLVHLQFVIDLRCYISIFVKIHGHSGDLVRKWEGRMLNIHPSLLPSFKGANAHKLVLEANVRISGCTVHFVAVSTVTELKPHV